jgi:hypothetical protein
VFTSKVRRRIIAGLAAAIAITPVVLTATSSQTPLVQREAKPVVAAPSTVAAANDRDDLAASRSHTRCPVTQCPPTTAPSREKPLADAAIAKAPESPPPAHKPTKPVRPAKPAAPAHHNNPAPAAPPVYNCAHQPYSGNCNITFAIVHQHGWNDTQASCQWWIELHESSGSQFARNKKSGAYGLGQALPASKMRPFGADYLTNPWTQVRWMVSYIASRYHTPCGAKSFWQAHNWY